MKAPGKRAFLILLALLITIAVVGSLTWYFWLRDSGDEPGNTADTAAENQSGTDGDDSEGTPEEIHPRMEMVITDYPAQIINDCQRVSFSATIKNVGEVDLDYDDVESGKYQFALNATAPSGSTSIVGSTSRGNISFSGLKDIPVGETIEITITTGKDYTNSYTGAIQHDNEISHGTSTENGNFAVTMTFNHKLSENRFTQYGESDPVTVAIDIWEDPSQSLLKFCE